MKYHAIAAAGLCALAITGTTAEAQVIAMATGAQGTLAYNSGQAVAVVANENGLTVRTQPLVGYMPLLQSGEVDFGYANGAEAAFAFTGTGNFDRAHPNVRLVGTMFNLTTGIMAPCDLGLQSVNDMVGRSDLRIASEYTSSTIIPYYIEGIFATAGLSYDDFTRVPVSSFVDGINALGGGLVDVALVSLGAGAGQQAAVQLQNRGGLCYVSMNDTPEALAAYTDVLPSGIIRAMPQNPNINGLQTWGANLVAVPWMLMANADVSEQVVYDLIRVIHTNQAALGAAFGAFNGADFTAMAPANAMPFHPGASRYFTEVGMPTGN
jgi:TRAP transporter TAXI family solute receptor